MEPDFGDVYNEHVWQVYGYLAYRVRTRGEAEDLTQQTFERALRAWGRYDEQKASVATWLLAIARNVLIDHQRKEGSRTQLSLDSDDMPERELPAVKAVDEDVGLSAELA